MVLFVVGIISLLLFSLAIIEMVIFFASALAVWGLVLTFFMLRDIRLLFRVLRWSASIWLLLLGVVVSEVLREGLVVNGDAPLYWNVQAAWTFWFVLVGLSFFDWRFLLPAVALPIWFLAQPEIQILLNFGLVRLGWMGIVHNPFVWVTTQTRMLEFSIHTRVLADEWIGKLILPVVRALNRFFDHVAGGLLWTVDGNWEKMRTPPPRWTLLPFAWYLY
ncbi:hypothetical protein EKO27_g11098 [Xylaria grammica]|uniref:Uncharacterized protein n=1 Tax=Xylaria grammica TaxID=363999 RepID=A0A439CPD5_9PEZI|nr:hypothetical protein EKO27_g11098 [Xylaria grammica]